MARPTISPALAADIYGYLHCSRMEFEADSYNGPVDFWFTLRKPMTRKDLLAKIRERKKIAERWGDEPWTFSAKDVVDQSCIEGGLVKTFKIKADTEGSCTKLIWSYLRCAFHDPAYKGRNILA